MYTFGQLKLDLRQRLWPEGEAANLVISHDAMFVDALADLQTWVECQQQDNTNLIPQCATFYNCGLTVFDAPRGRIKKLSVVDKINPTTGLEDATAADDWCSEIPYNQVDHCHIEAYLRGSQRRGCCLPLTFFFGLSPCGKGHFPVPTDVGVPKSLPILPLGYHYPQLSTDRSYGRARSGIWAIERGKIFIAPWIQTTETVVIKWDGIKRVWADADPLDADPMLQQAVEEYVRWKHAGIWDHDEAEAARAQAAYVNARQLLWHECREETRVRECEPSHARSATTITNLFYNEEQSASAQCSEGTIGLPVTVTIPAGSIASVVSVADANQKAKDEAQTQAVARLDCQPVAVTFSNDAQSATVACRGEEGAPPPDGAPVTITIPAGTVTSTVSKADANAQALAQAEAAAGAQLKCTYWNKEVSYTATCPSNPNIAPITVTTPAHMFSSTISQSDADAQATNAAKTQAETAMAALCVQTGLFWNTEQRTQYIFHNCLMRTDTGFTPCDVIVNCVVAAHQFSSQTSQADANQQAINFGTTLCAEQGRAYCQFGQCGVYDITFP